MAASTSAAAQTAERELVLTRVFDAPRALVFEAWIRPELAARWLGPQGFTTLSAAMDARPGGAWRVSTRSPAGSTHTMRGVYREIVAPERLVFTFAWEDADGKPKHEMLIALSFAEQGEETRLTLHQTQFESAAARDEHRGGWTSCLERFAAFLAELQRAA